MLLCILLPLLLCTIGIHYYSARSLLREMDTSMKRSLQNTNATLETLFEEVCATLEKESFDSNITDLLQKERDGQVNYESIVLSKNVIDRLAMDLRENLHYSIDLYSAVSGVLTSTLYKSQAMGWIKDQSLLSTFEEYTKYDSLEGKQGQILFAAPRTANYLGQRRLVITVYQLVIAAKENRAFISISVDADKLISYIVDENAPNQNHLSPLV